MSWRSLLPLILTIAAIPAAAEPIVGAREYADCLATARVNADQGFERAQRWEALGGGEAARHCGAVALIGLREYTVAARRLQDLAEHSRREPQVRAGMLAQAAQAMLLAGQPALAFGLQSAALKLTPNDARILVDRAATLADARNYWEAIDDLNRALELEPSRVEALVFRASAYRYVDAFDLARYDVDLALKMAPNNVDALLERGMLERLAGDDGAARNDWIRILRLDPTTAAADAARRNIELMDVKTGP